jgi:uncharacterized membrane protein YdbT with pleckstrin-like domain
MLLPGRAVQRSTIDHMEEAPSRSLGRKLIAGIVLVVAAFIILKVIIHTFLWVVGIVVVGAAIIALLWALNTLL